MVPPVVGLLNVTAVVDVLLHTTWLATALMVAVGFTVMVKVIGVPLQVTPPLVKAGVTVMVAVTGAVVALVAVKPAILPEPFAANPMDVVLLVQLYTIVPPVLGLLNVTVVVDVLLHTTWLATAFIVATGFTVIVKVTGVPLQVTPPLVKEGVTVMVAVTGAVVAFVAVKPAILPEPFAANPMDVVLLVQL